MVSKKVKKKKIFFYLFNWEKQTWYWEKSWPFFIGNGAEIRPLEMGRKSPASGLSILLHGVLSLPDATLLSIKLRVNMRV